MTLYDNVYNYERELEQSLHYDEMIRWEHDRAEISMRNDEDPADFYLTP